MYASKSIGVLYLALHGTLGIIYFNAPLKVTINESQDTQSHDVVLWYRRHPCFVRKKYKRNA